VRRGEVRVSGRDLMQAAAGRAPVTHWQQGMQGSRQLLACRSLYLKNSRATPSCGRPTLD